MNDIVGTGPADLGMEPPTIEGARHFRAEQTMLPCPFCGKAGEIIGQSYPPLGKLYGIICETCDIFCDYRAKTEMDAALLWNRRDDIGDKIAWLVEKNAILPEYWGRVSDDNEDGPIGWTHDHNAALQFVRYEDAQAQIDYWGWTSTEVHPVAHLWPLPREARDRKTEDLLPIAQALFHRVTAYGGLDEGLLSDIHAFRARLLVAKARREVILSFADAMTHEQLALERLLSKVDRLESEIAALAQESAANGNQP